MNKEMTGDVQTTQERKPAHRKLSLRMNFSCTFAAQLIYSFARWLIILIVAKLGDPTSVGLVVLAQAICMPVLWASRLNLRPALVTDAKNKYTYGQYIGLRIATSPAALVALAGGGGLLRPVANPARCAA